MDGRLGEREWKPRQASSGGRVQLGYGAGSVKGMRHRDETRGERQDFIYLFYLFIFIFILFFCFCFCFFVFLGIREDKPQCFKKKKKLVQI
jgi:hypothetical protein